MPIHINASPDDIAETVLLPGDPGRAKFIAENFLADPVCYNDTRGELGYTGLLKKKRVSVQATGMGMPSIAIYGRELIDLGAKKLIRVGTMGSIQTDLNVGDVVLAASASTDSSINDHTFSGTFAPTADWWLLYAASQVSMAMGLKVTVGNVLSTDKFYNEMENWWQVWQSHGVLGAEMESAALYTLAARNKVAALSILTVSDHILTGEESTAEAREKTFTDMVEIALQMV